MKKHSEKWKEKTTANNPGCEYEITEAKGILAVRGGMMTSQQYLLSIIDMNALFKIRDALDIMKQFGLADAFIYQDVYAEIEKRTV